MSDQPSSDATEERAQQLENMVVLDDGQSTDIQPTTSFSAVDFAGTASESEDSTVEHNVDTTLHNLSCVVESFVRAMLPTLRAQIISEIDVVLMHAHRTQTPNVESKILGIISSNYKVDDYIICAIMSHGLGVPVYGLHKLLLRWSSTRPKIEPETFDDLLSIYPNRQSLFLNISVYGDIFSIFHVIDKNNKAIVEKLRTGRKLRFVWRSDVFPDMNHYLRQYLQQLLVFEKEYEWSSILSYHVRFWDSRCEETRRGKLDGWKVVDENLKKECLRNRGGKN